MVPTAIRTSRKEGYPLLLKLYAYIQSNAHCVFSIVMNTRSALLLFAAISSASAHPMGNFSISHYARLTPAAEGVAITYALDVAGNSQL